MTLEILKSMAKEGQVFSFSHLYEKTHIKKEVLKVILSRIPAIWRHGMSGRVHFRPGTRVTLRPDRGSFSLPRLTRSSLSF